MRGSILLTLVALEGCGGGVASSSSLQAQTQAAANPSPTATTSDVPMSEAMFEAQLLCTTALSYRPCALVAASDTVSCFTLCHGQITTGAAQIVERSAQACAASPPPADAGSPLCEIVVADDSPVDPLQLRAACDARCRELASDAAAPASP